MIDRWATFPLEILASVISHTLLSLSCPKNPGSSPNISCLGAVILLSYRFIFIYTLYSSLYKLHLKMESFCVNKLNGKGEIIAIIYNIFILYVLRYRKNTKLNQEYAVFYDFYIYKSWQFILNCIYLQSHNFSYG